MTDAELRRVVAGGALSAALIAGGLIIAFSSNSKVDASPNPSAVVAPGPTISGNYLAAQHARARGEDSDAAAFLLSALKRSPNDPVLLGRAYVGLTLDGRVGDAVEIARRFTQIEGGTVLAQLVVAAGDLREGRFDAAAQRLGKVPPSALSSFLVPLLQAWAEFGRGDVQVAKASLEKLRRDPALTVLYDVHAAWLSDAAGDRAAALQHADAAVKAQGEPWLRLAELAGGVYERAGRRDDAEALYREYVDKHPDSRLLDPAMERLRSAKPPARDIATARDGAAEAFFDAAGVVGRQNTRETALALGQLGLYLRPDFPALQILVGDMLESSGRYAQANRVYAGIRASDPLSTTARIAIARNLERQDRFDEARASLLKLAAERPGDPDPVSELADMLRRREAFAEAVGVYDQALGRIETLQPRHWRLLYARGIALERSKQWPRAEQDFLKALEFEPDQPLILNYLGYSWVEQGRNLEQAEAMIRKAVDLRPDDGYIVDSLGWVLFRLGRYEEAVTHLERAVELKSEDAVINDHLGDALWAVGRTREARFQWQAALASNPEPDLKSSLEKKLTEGLVRAASDDAK